MLYPAACGRCALPDTRHMLAATCFVAMYVHAHGAQISTGVVSMACLLIRNWREHAEAQLLLVLVLSATPGEQVSRADDNRAS